MHQTFRLFFSFDTLKRLRVFYSSTAAVQSSLSSSYTALLLLNPSSVCNQTFQLLYLSVALPKQHRYFKNCHSVDFLFHRRHSSMNGTLYSIHFGLRHEASHKEIL